MFIGIILSKYFMFGFFPIYVNAEQINDTTLSQKSFDMTPFFWAVGIVGGCIAITLAYVSWKKYKAEEKKKKKDTTVD